VTDRSILWIIVAIADGRRKHGLKAPPVRKSAIVYKISLVNKRLTAPAFLKSGKNLTYKEPPY